MKKFIEALKRNGVSQSAIRMAIESAKRKEVKLTRALIADANEALSSNGSCVLTVTVEGRIRLWSLSGYLALRDNAKKAREGKRNGDAGATG